MKHLLLAVIMSMSAGAESLRITLYSTANITAGDIDFAESELRRIFRLSGIEVQWIIGNKTAQEASLMIYAGTPLKGQEQLSLCRARRDIALEIVRMAPPGLKKTILGMAQPLASAGLNVRVFADHVREAAERHSRAYSKMLAHVIAHEIGHVLLRSGDHTGGGLMTNVWTQTEYLLMASGSLFFTGAQSKAMRATLVGSGCPDSRTDQRSSTAPAPPERTTQSPNEYR